MRPHVTMIGNLTRDPELRFTANGQAVCSFTVASTDRRKVGDQWEDLGTTFADVTCWRTTAENVAETLLKGDEVIVTGVLEQRSYEAKDGTTRTVFQVNAREVGLSLRKLSAAPNRVDKKPQADPWATPAVPDEAPF